MYELAMEKMLADNEGGKNNRNIIECCMYLGNYYLENKDKTTAIDYFNKVLEITPDNENLKKADRTPYQYLSRYNSAAVSQNFPASPKRIARLLLPSHYTD